MDCKQDLEKLLKELIDKGVIYEWYVNGDGYHWSYVKDRCDAVKQTGFENKVDMEKLVNGAIPKISKIEKEITELHEEGKRK